MEGFISIPISDLFMAALVAAVVTVGVMEWLKNLIHHKKLFPVTTLIICAGSGILNTSVVPPAITAIVDTVLICLAISQLAYQTLLQGIPRIIDRLLVSLAGSKSSD